MKSIDARAMIATIRHDARTGNLDKARRLAHELFDGRWDEASPVELENACLLVEAKLDEAEIR